jgi:hypothetical protein
VGTTWIPVFVLTLSECVAPVGKTVCRPQELHLQFVDQAECETALREIIELKSLAENIIVNRDASRCERSARSIESYTSFEELGQAFAGIRNLESRVERHTADDTLQAHQKRLTELQTCEETAGLAPCKFGEIIIESANGEQLEVWRREH